PDNVRCGAECATATSVLCSQPPQPCVERYAVSAVIGIRASRKDVGRFEAGDSMKEEVPLITAKVTRPVRIRSARLSADLLCQLYWCNQQIRRIGRKVRRRAIWLQQPYSTSLKILNDVAVIKGAPVSAPNHARLFNVRFVVNPFLMGVVVSIIP